MNKEFNPYYISVANTPNISITPEEEVSVPMPIADTHLKKP